MTTGGGMNYDHFLVNRDTLLEFATDFRVLKLSESQVKNKRAGKPGISDHHPVVLTVRRYHNRARQINRRGDVEAKYKEIEGEVDDRAVLQDIDDALLEIEVGLEAQEKEEVIPLRQMTCTKAREILIDRYHLTEQEVKDFRKTEYLRTLLKENYGVVGLHSHGGWTQEKVDKVIKSIEERATKASSTKGARNPDALNTSGEDISRLFSTEVMPPTDICIKCKSFIRWYTILG